MTIREYIGNNRDALEKLTTSEKTKEIVAAQNCSERRAMKVIGEEFRKADRIGVFQHPLEFENLGLGSKKVSMSRAELLARYDTGTRTRDAIAAGVKTLTDDDAIIPSSEFCRTRCIGASPSLFRQIAAEPRFLDCQFRVGDQTYWTTPATRTWALQNVSRAREL